MQANVEVPGHVYENQPIVMATTTFENGMLVAMGVLKSDEPEAYNTKFCYAFDTEGRLIDPQPIDVSDHEDFMQKSISFILGEDESVAYFLEILEG